MWLIVISILVTIVSLVYHYLTWNFNYWKYRGVPGPLPKPFLGTFSSTFTQKEHPIEENNRIYREYRKDVPFIGGFSFRSPQLFALSPTLVKDILVKYHKHFRANEVGGTFDSKADPLLARNPFFLDGEEWRSKRAQITPAFTNSRLKALLPIMDNICNNMVSYIDRHIPNGPIESKELSAKYTTDVVSSCIFGAEGGSLTSDRSEIREMGNALFQQTFMFIVLAVISSIAPILKRFVKLSLIPKSIENYFVGLMTEAVRKRKASGTKQVDYLDHLINLQEQKEISILDMAAHGVTFFIDGFETTSEVLGFSLLELSIDKEIQNRLRQEIHSAEDGQLTFETIMELPYLDQIVNETLRKWPPAYALSKRCTEEITFRLKDNHEVLIEKGITAILPIWAIHLDKEFYPDPNRFNPDRFSEEDGGHSVRYYQEKGVFLPFGDGPRACIGRRIGLLQVKRALVEIVKNYDFTVNSKTVLPIKIDPKNIAVTPLGGIWIDYRKL
ncbi:probable cytochrome P450 28a5 [Aedes aegypti]|uniref:Uncharacterized protein n=1 Tax=Aedes aegypti TaxID=7159 RepID=A0A6I8TDG5_AEDAE|nr:probable cytochrome P450 28a5 [Aedes aegypti]